MKIREKHFHRLFVVLLILVSVVLVLGQFMGEATTKASDVGTIQGWVLDVNGNPVANATINVMGQTATAVTVANGSFTLTNVEPDLVYLSITTSSTAYLNGETLKSINVGAKANVSGVEITLSGRPSENAKYVGMEPCAMCHSQSMEDIFEDFNSDPDSSIHSRFVNEGTGNMVYPDLWPQPGENNYIPRNPAGEPLLVQDPRDGHGMVNTVLLTVDGEDGREYWFKFFPELDENTSPRTEAELETPSGTPQTGMPDSDTDPVWIPVAATIGGEGNWGEGYIDPDHMTEDNDPNFGEGKQRFMARTQDIPYFVTWYEEHGLSLDRDKQDYVAYMPVYIYQDGTPTGSEALSLGDVGSPKFRLKSPDHWCTPDNTLSRNCAGCHATGVEIEYTNVVTEEKTYKAIVTAFDYKDLNITCERCHGPGSEHASSTNKTDIISPQYLSAKASNELCGQCHSSHSGKSATPEGVFKYPFDETYKDTLGNGYFVPGVYEMDTFYYNYNQPSINNSWKEGPFHAWSDETHGRAHGTELPELLQSSHVDNPYQKLTCFICHDSHSLDVAATLSVDDYEFEKPAYNDNVLCLACHAGNEHFEDISKDDVAALQIYAGRETIKNGTEVSLAPADIDIARNRVEEAVAEHMSTIGMEDAPYTPTDPDMPSGSCTSCHMPKIGKLFDVNDDAQYHLALDANGDSAVAEGNVASHVFDIVMPFESSMLKNPDPSQGHDYDIMPNSCSNCHAFARFSGDNSDSDVDGDGYLNADDALPFNSTEWNDIDGDGIGDNADTDVDGDGYLNADDAFPSDSTEWSDTDGDGIGDNADTDVDGDGMLDTWETANGLDPMDASDAFADPDGDGLINLLEYIDETNPQVAAAIADEGVGDFGLNLLSYILLIVIIVLVIILAISGGKKGKGPETTTKPEPKAAAPEPETPEQEYTKEDIS